MAACSARLKTFDVKTGKHRLSGVPSNSPKSGQWSVKSWHFTIIHLSDQLMLHITELSTFPSTLMIFDPCFINSLILNQSSVVGTYSLFNLACSFFLPRHRSRSLFPFLLSSFSFFVSHRSLLSLRSSYVFVCVTTICVSPLHEIHTFIRTSSLSIRRHTLAHSLGSLSAR